MVFLLASVVTASGRDGDAPSVVTPALGNSASGNAAVGVARAAWPRPALRDSVAPPVQRQLILGHRLAQERLGESASCRALFAQLGADGPTVLGLDHYGAANAETVRHGCPRGAAAITSVRSFEVRLCPGFGVLSTTDAAMILIHEALHSAGMKEKPPDPEALAPQEINHLVRTACAL